MFFVENCRLRSSPYRHQHDVSAIRDAVRRREVFFTRVSKLRYFSKWPNGVPKPKSPKIIRMTRLRIHLDSNRYLIERCTASLLFNPRPLSLLETGLVSLLSQTESAAVVRRAIRLHNFDDS